MACPIWMTIFVLGAVLGWYGFPALERSQIVSNLALREGSERRQIWEKAPYPMDFKIYLFNVTNPVEAQKGETVIVKEGMVKEAQRINPVALKFINSAIPHIFNNATSMFVTARARDILFDGVVFNCTSDDFSTKAVCTELKKKSHYFHRVKEDIFKISIFGTKNGTVRERMEVKRGIENIKDVGRVVEFRGQSELNIWSGAECNKLKGTDTTIFPPFLTKKDKIIGFLPDLCRASEAEYQYSTTYRGIRSFKYSADFGDSSSDPEITCYCLANTTCLKRGVHDISRCAEIPIVVSLPHFYLADEEYQDAVIGLTPDQDKHEITLLFEPFTATPLEAYKRLQLNIFAVRTESIDLLKHIKPALLPILWYQENMELHQEYVDNILDFFIIRSVTAAMKWIMITTGGILTATGLFFIMRKKNDDNTVITGSPRIALKSTGQPPMKMTQIIGKQ